MSSRQLTCYFSFPLFTTTTPFKSTSRFVTNSSDRTLRQFNVPTYPDEIGSGSSSGSNSNSNPNTTNGDAIGNHQARSPDGVEHQPLGLTTPSGVLEQDLEPTHRFNDPINKTAWHAMAFSPDGEWLAGGAFSMVVQLLLPTHAISFGRQAQRTQQHIRYTSGTSPTMANLRVRWMEEGSR